MALCADEGIGEHSYSIDLNQRSELPIHQGYREDSPESTRSLRGRKRLHLAACAGVRRTAARRIVRNMTTAGDESRRGECMPISPQEARTSVVRVTFEDTTASAYLKAARNPVRGRGRQGPGMNGLEQFPDDG